MPGVPVIEDPTDTPDNSQELIGVPYVPDTPLPAPPPQPEMSEPDRQRAIKRSRLRLEQATAEVERLKPTVEKGALAAGMNFLDSMVGSTKQVVGNAARWYADIVAPEKPHAVGSPEYYLQTALRPLDLAGGALGIAQSAVGGENPEAPGNLLREAGHSLADEGSKQLGDAAYETEQLGGGPIVSGIGALASTAGSSAPMMLAGPFGMGAMGAAAGLQTFGSTVEQFKSKLQELDPNLTEQQAFDKSLLPSAAAAAATALITRGFGGVEGLIEKITSRGLSQVGAKAAIKEVFKAASMEFPEEFTDQLTQGIIEKAFIDPNKKVSEIFDDAAMAGLQGFALGGITGSAMHGVVHGTTAAVGKVAEAADRSKLRRAIGDEGNAAIRRAIENKGRNYGQGEIAPPGRLPDVQGKPAVAGAEEQAQGGTPLGSSPGGTEQAAKPAVQSTSDIVTKAIAEVQAPPPPVKRAIFGGYSFNDPSRPSYKIPGVRPGTWRDVTLETARQLGYEIPVDNPTMDQWQAAGRPATWNNRSWVSPNHKIFGGTSSAPVVESASRVAPEQNGTADGSVGTLQAIESSSPMTPQKPTPVVVQLADGTLRQGEFTGYYDYREVGIGTPASVGFLNSKGEMSHGMLPKGAKILTKVPTFEQWSGAQDSAAAAPGKLTYAEKVKLNELASRPVDWKQFVVDDPNTPDFARGLDGAHLDLDKIRAALKDGSLVGHPAMVELLDHILKETTIRRAGERQIGASMDNHPLNGITLWDMTPKARLAMWGDQASSFGGEYQGVFYQYRGNNIGHIEIVLRNSDGSPMIQQHFVATLLHELIHNVVTSKLKKGASPELRKAANDLYQWFLMEIKGTSLEGCYAATNVDEFFSEAISNKKIQAFLKSRNYYNEKPKHAHSVLKSAWKKFTEVTASLLGFERPSDSPFVDGLEEAIAISAKLYDVKRSAAEVKANPGLEETAASRPSEETQSRVQGPSTEAEGGIRPDTTRTDAAFADVPKNTLFLLQSQKATVKELLQSLIRHRDVEHNSSVLTEIARELLRAGDTEGLNVRVFYSPNANNSFYSMLHDNIEMRPDSSGNVSEAILVHEIIHAFTAKKVYPLLGMAGQTMVGKLYWQALEAAYTDADPIQKKLIDLYREAVIHYSTTTADIMNLVGDAPELFRRYGHPYGLGDIHEFLAEAFSNRKFQIFLDGMPSKTQPKKSIWGEIVEWIRMAVKWPPNKRSMLQDVLETGAELISKKRGTSGTWAGEAYGSPEDIRMAAPVSPATPPTLPASIENLGIKDAAVQGGAAEVGRIAQEIYTQREQAVRDLEALAYERRQYRLASREIRRLNDLAAAGYLQLGLDPEQFQLADSDTGVRIQDGEIVVDNSFTDGLTLTDVPHNVENVQHLQAQLFYERSAMRFNNLNEQLATLDKARQYYVDLKVHPDEIAKLDEQIGRLENQVHALGAATLGADGATVEERANEMRDAETWRQERLAARNALTLEPVADFFGRQVGSYRQFAERLQSALTMAHATLNAATDPEAIRRATEGVQGWMNLPNDIRTSILAGRPLTFEQRSAIFSALAQVFEEFNFSRQRMQELAASRIPEIDKEIRAKLEQLAKAKVDSGMAAVLIADVWSTMGGMTGMTGNLKSLQENQALQQRISAIESFAMALGQDLQHNWELFDWLSNPGAPKPNIPPGVNLGADPVTIQMILNEVQRSPAFGSAVLTLVEASRSKLQALPITNLTRIQELLEENTVESQAEAQRISRDMLRRARSQASVGEAALRDSLRQIDALEIERRSLQEGLAMFAQMAESPEFGRVRDAVQNSPFGLVEPMVPQNHTETTFKPFGSAGIPSHPGLVLSADRDTSFKAEWFKKVAEWHKAAQDHLDAYDTAALAYAKDPVANPSPQSLGFDIPKVRGLRDATQRFVPGAFLELSLNSEGGRWKVPWLARVLSRNVLFRQHDFVAKMVGGMTGTDLRARLGDFVNHFLIAQGIRDKYKDIPDKLHKALRSHPEFKMNIASYREFFNEMAHWGRMFGSPVRVGMLLPRSGWVVTEADMALLQRERAYEEELRRRVTETNETQGIRVKTQTRDLVRPGAHVGDEGLPRFPGRRATPWIADVLAAYNVPLPPNSPPGARVQVHTFDPTTDLGASSSNPVVQFWNRNTQHLIQHILDARRTDRQMVLGPGMAQAEADLAAQWIVHGVPVNLGSVEDLVNALVATHPPTPGLNTRDLVVNGLNAELRQYRDAAQRISTDRAEREQARQAKPEIAFSADNEFTKPAAKLELPSALYDYGALSPGEHMTLNSRSNHERIIAYATAVQRAISELESRYARYQDGSIDEKTAAAAYGGDIKEMVDVLGILKKIQADFANAYAIGSFSNVPRGLLNDTLGLLTSAILALPTVGLRNMTQGQFEVYAMSRAMGTAGHWLTAYQALKALPKTLVRFALHLGDGIIKRTNLGAALLTGTNYHLFEDAVRKFGNMIAGEDFQAVAARIGELGMDGRDSFLQRLARIWQETSEFVSKEDMEKSWSVGGRKVRSTAAFLPKVIKAIFDKVGVQQYDFAINSAALSYAELLVSRMKQVAVAYGQARENLGAFDPTNRAFDLKASEWGSGPEAADTLANLRQILEASVSAEGFQMESSMWNFYQRHKAGVPNNRLFTERQMDALQRRILSDMNASTPANRPSSASAHGVLRNLLMLQGYPSDLMLKILNTSWGGVRDRKGMANALVKAPVIAMLALMAVLIGYVTSAVTGGWEKYVRGRMPSLATTLDADFWTNWKRFGEGTLALGAAQFGYLGDFILALMGEVRGNRGFDPTGRILGVSLATRALTALRGAYNTAKAGGTFKDVIVPGVDVGRSMVPFWLEAERVLGNSQGAIKQAERVRRGEAQTQGMLEGRSGFTPPSYGPTTVFRRNLGDAVSALYAAQQSGDKVGAERALADARTQMAKLEEYHYQKYLAAGKDPATARQMAQRDTWNDYQDINPAVAAMLGRRPTADQNNLMLQGITGERRKVVDAGDAAWKLGATALFNRQGVTTREESAAARGSTGGGRGFSLAGTKMASFPSTTRKPSANLTGIPGGSPLRGVQSRVRRAEQAPLRAVKSGTSAVRRAAGLTAKGTSKRKRSSASSRIRHQPARKLGSRRRRDYAAA